MYSFSVTRNFFLITSRKPSGKEITTNSMRPSGKKCSEHKKKTYQQLQHDNINILAQIINIYLKIHAFIKPCTWPMRKLDKNRAIIFSARVDLKGSRGEQSSFRTEIQDSTRRKRQVRPNLWCLFRVCNKAAVHVTSEEANAII